MGTSGQYLCNVHQELELTLSNTPSCWDTDNFDQGFDESRFKYQAMSIRKWVFITSVSSLACISLGGWLLSFQESLYFFIIIICLHFHSRYVSCDGDRIALPTSVVQQSCMAFQLYSISPCSHLGRRHSHYK